jgi:hypothetical protein
LTKASLLAIIFSVRRGSGQNLELVDNEPVDMLHEMVAAASGTCSLMLPAVAWGFFLTKLSRIEGSLLVRLAGCPESFFSQGGHGEKGPQAWRGYA